MCGIVYCKDFRGKSVIKRAGRRYQAQRNRGTQGFGYYLPTIDRLSHSPDEVQILNDMLDMGERLPAQKTSEVLFHHRFPTSTDNVRNACHPFSTRWEGFKNNYVMVHNGWLTNDETLRKAHYERGIRYISEQPDGRFNDSEALLYDLALYLEGYQDAPKAEGAIAFVMIERTDGKPNRLLFGRNNSSPLKIKYKPGVLLNLASEGKGDDVEPHKLYSFDYQSKLMLAPVDVTFQSYATTKSHWWGNYSDYDDYTPVASGSGIANRDDWDDFAWDWFEDDEFGKVHMYTRGADVPKVCHYGDTYTNCPQRDLFDYEPVKDRTEANIISMVNMPLDDKDDEILSAAQEIVDSYLVDSESDYNQALRMAENDLEFYTTERNRALHELQVAEKGNDTNKYLEADEMYLTMLKSHKATSTAIVILQAAGARSKSHVSK